MSNSTVSISLSLSVSLLLHYVFLPKYQLNAFAPNKKKQNKTEHFLFASHWHAFYPSIRKRLADRLPQGHWSSDSSGTGLPFCLVVVGDGRWRGCLAFRWRLKTLLPNFSWIFSGAKANFHILHSLEKLNSMHSADHVIYKSIKHRGVTWPGHSEL